MADGTVPFKACGSVARDVFNWAAAGSGRRPHRVRGDNGVQVPVAQQHGHGAVVDGRYTQVGHFARTLIRPALRANGRKDEGGAASRGTQKGLSP